MTGAPSCLWQGKESVAPIKLSKHKTLELCHDTKTFIPLLFTEKDSMTKIHEIVYCILRKLLSQNIKLQKMGSIFHVFAEGLREFKAIPSGTLWEWINKSAQVVD